METDTDLAVTMAERIELRPIDDLRPYDKNPRLHSSEQVRKIAASIRAFGFNAPILVDETSGEIIAGHGRLMAAQLLQLESVPVVVLDHLSEDDRRAYVIADNKLNDESGWDEKMLAEELTALAAADDFEDLTLTGFDDDEIGDMLGDDLVLVNSHWRLKAGHGSDSSEGDSAELGGDNSADQNIPEPKKHPVTMAGDVWLLGDHRVMCGDSTNADQVAKLMDGKKALLVHADPPYGMGKESDGVANDNLNPNKLVDFQREWWNTYRPHVEFNASAYVWGNAENLWRFWFLGELHTSEEICLRNEIVWDKGGGPGMASEAGHSYVVATERCLFFMLGKQFIGNVNSCDYWEGWDEIRLPLVEELEKVGWAAPEVREITGTQMFAHWFTKSQWAFISEKHYTSLAEAADGEAFTQPWAELRKQYEKIKGGYRSHVNGMLGGMRAYFDNTHDIMRDVWQFPRVVNEERYGHAKPKPVAMIERALMTSLPIGGLVVEPFAGSGSTLIAAESADRVCYTMELQPEWCDVTVQRWQEFAGQQAKLEGDGRTFDEVRAERIDSSPI